MLIIIFKAMRVILYWVQVLEPLVRMLHPISMAARTPATLYFEEADGVIFPVCGVCKHTVDLCVLNPVPQGPG